MGNVFTGISYFQNCQNEDLENGKDSRKVSRQSRSQRPRSFWSATGIDRSRFFQRMTKGTPGDEVGLVRNIDRKLYSCQRPLVSIRSTPENMTVLNGKQKVLLGGKQLKDNA